MTGHKPSPPRPSLDGCIEVDSGLIAAAPDLLARLMSARELLSAFDGVSRNNFANLAAEEIDEIDAAIAKASPPVTP